MAKGAIAKASARRCYLAASERQWITRRRSMTTPAKDRFLETVSKIPGQAKKLDWDLDGRLAPGAEISKHRLQAQRRASVPLPSDKLHRRGQPQRSVGCHAALSTRHHEPASSGIE
jgi:hypothetical protein